MEDQNGMNSLALVGFNTIDDNAIDGNGVVGIETEMSVTPKKRSAKRKRRLRSAVWGYFELLPSGKDGRQRCKCRNCGTSYLYDSKFGTGNMKRHLKTCLKREARDAGQLLLARHDNPVMPQFTPKFDHDKFKEVLVGAVIMHDLPLQIVEWAGIRDLLLYFCPDLQIGTRNNIGADCIEVYKREKARLRDILQATPNRISLTCDLWSSLNSDDYICLTAYFIDNDWNLQKKLLNFSFTSPFSNGTPLGEKIQDFLIDWGIDKKLSTITMNSALTSIIGSELLKSQLTSKGHLWDDELFHLHCCARTVELIVQEVLKEIDEALCKIRESIKFIKSSHARKEKFLECVTDSSLDHKIGLRPDAPTWWSSTYIMLDDALYYRHAFTRLELRDLNYQDCPTMSEWDNLEKVAKLLAVFYDITCVFSSTKHPTANLYFPVVFSAYLTLKEGIGSNDECLRTLAANMLCKLEKYWSDFSMILAIAVIFDPRYKFCFVEWCYKKLHGDCGVQESMKVKEKLFSLFNKYNSSIDLLPGPKTAIVADESSVKDNFNASVRPFLKSTDEFLKEFDSLASENASLQKSQLELYLDEPRIDRKIALDVLSYWRANQCRYSDVAAMARDVLCIPFSTVTVESALDENDRVLDLHQSALKPEVLEAFICARDWFHGGDGIRFTRSETTKLMLEELTKNILQLKANDEVELSECSTLPNHN